jgi:hypothetical protein
MNNRIPLSKEAAVSEIAEIWGEGELPQQMADLVDAGLDADQVLPLFFLFSRMERLVEEGRGMSAKDVVISLTLLNHFVDYLPEQIFANYDGLLDDAAEHIRTLTQPSDN